MTIDKHLLHYRQIPRTKLVGSFNAFGIFLAMTDNNFLSPFGKADYRMDSKSWQTSPMSQSTLLLCSVQKDKMKSAFLPTLKYNIT